MTNNSRFKFRAFNKRTNAMVDLQKITPLALDPDLEVNGIFIPFDDDLIILQYADKRDKNKKDIYAGDIFKFELAPNMITKHVVKYEDGAFLFYPHPIGGGTGLLFTLPEHAIEIIGDIYRNPELLEEK